MTDRDFTGHVTGRSVFLDDIPEICGTLHAVVFASDIARGRIKVLDLEAASALPGVVRIFTARDIPGNNQIGGIIQDEPLLAFGELHFAGQPLALVVADTELTARRSARLIRTEFEEYEPVTDPRAARVMGELLFPPRTFRCGEVESAWGRCDHVFQGTAETGGQEHVYLETQGAYACLRENSSLLIHSSTQSPAVIQKIAARVLGIPMHRIEVEVQRLGGGFGGKEDQATAWACLAAMAAYLLRKPVKLVLSRHDDLFMTGKRHPYSTDFRIGLTKELKIVAWEVTYYQNGGAAADLSSAIMERTLFHSTNSYFIPNVKATAYSCRTNLPPNTAFRGFGAPQAMFVMESAIALAARKLGISPRMIQEQNLVCDGDAFPYGQVTEDTHAVPAWEEACKIYDIDAREREIQLFNKSESLLKRGLALMPVCFGISFTTKAMNQASALVHIYQDGSIGISSGAVEMGQGVNSRLRHIAAHTLSVSPGRIRVETTNTTRVANSSPTAASTGADLNGKALVNACHSLLTRLKDEASKLTGLDAKTLSITNEQVYADGSPTGIGWEKLVLSAYLDRVGLSESGHYATPVIYFDKSSEKGHPFAYYVYGTAIVTVTLDCLRGRYSVDSVQIVHDFGKSMNINIDMGQVEGAVVQGIGWMTMEEVRYNERGRLLSDSLSTYKVPDRYATPKVLECKALDADGPDLAVLRSKAIGEPPLMYGIGAFFALQEAILAFNPDARIEFAAPLTPEKVLLLLYGEEEM